MLKTYLQQVLRTHLIYFSRGCIGTSIHRSNMTSRKLHCCANLPFLFKEEEDILVRFRKAKEAGFEAVEYPCPEKFGIADVVKSQEENNLVTVMMNCCIFDSQNGFAAILGMESQFLKSLEKSIEYCKALRCYKLHVVSGIVDNPTADHDRTYEQNIRTAVEVCQAQGITVLIEPISPIALPNYYLNSFEKAVKLIRKINSPYLKLQVDLYHLQRMNGNLAANIKDWFPIIGHIQVAQVPNRNEPDTPGEINYSYIFELLVELKYDKWIGFEYNPKIFGDAAVGLGFVEKMGLSLEKPEISS